LDEVESISGMLVVRKQAMPIAEIHFVLLQQDPAGGLARQQAMLRLALTFYPKDV
jgi:hypothetical protein